MRKNELGTDLKNQNVSLRLFVYYRHNACFCGSREELHTPTTARERLSELSKSKENFTPELITNVTASAYRIAPPSLWFV